MASERVQRRIDRLLDQPEEAMDRLDWDSVRDCAQAVLGLDSENADALAFLDSADRVLRNQPSDGAHEIPRSPNDRSQASTSGRCPASSSWTEKSRSGTD